MPLQNLQEGRLRVAIIGAGPAGLGAAIEFGKLPFVDWRIYEKATALREIGAGISIGRATWRMLEVVGAAQNLKDHFRPADNHALQHRNGRTGEILVTHWQKGFIRLSSKLSKVERVPSGRLEIQFEDGFKDEIDLLVGADGFRSAVRGFAFPDYHIKYIGRASYRTVVTSKEIATIPNVPEAVIFWHGPDGWTYTCPLGDNKFEITCNTPESDPQITEGKDWDQDATIQQNARHFTEFSPLIKDIVALPKEIKRYPLFAGPALQHFTQYGSIALIGDAAHPLPTGLGSGAGFALEDAYALTKGIAWAHENNLSLGDGLKLFDVVRVPFFNKVHGVLQFFTETDRRLEKLDLNFDEKTRALVDAKWSGIFDWVYDYNIVEDMKDILRRKPTEHHTVIESSRL